MPETPMVSVLMTAYNREKYIAEAIESVLASTYKDFELVIVDDCSSDKTVEISKQYEAKDNRVKVFVNEKNLGDYPNRNKAASYATGHYIMYVDSDDFILENHIETSLTICLNDPNVKLVLPSRIHDEFTGKCKLSPLESYTEHFYHSGFLETGPLGALICSDSFYEIGGFSGRRMIGDVELFLNLSSKFYIVRIDSKGINSRVDNTKESNFGEYFYLVEILDVYKTALFATNCPIINKRYSLISMKFFERESVIVKRFLKTLNPKYITYFFKAIYYLFK